MTPTKFQFLRQHFRACLLGSIRAFFCKPLTFPLTFWHRARFFVTRKFVPFRCCDGWRIESEQEQLTHWEMFVERCMAGAWFDEVKRIARESNEQVVVLDIGANRGVFARWIRSEIPNAFVSAVEPQPELVKPLQSNPAVGRIDNVALSNKTGTATLHYIRETASLEGTLHHGDRERSVEVRRLDDVWENRPDPLLIKIDVDGHEPALIEGGQRTIARARFVIVEAMTPEELQAIQAAMPDRGRWNWRRLDVCNHLATRME